MMTNVVVSFEANSLHIVAQKRYHELLMWVLSHDHVYHTGGVRSAWLNDNYRFLDTNRGEELIVEWDKFPLISSEEMQLHLDAGLSSNEILGEIQGKLNEVKATIEKWLAK